MPGGIGTVLETLMIWQLLQVRHVDNVPLILVGKMWKGFVEWAQTAMLDPRLALASPEDLQIFRAAWTRPTRPLPSSASCTRRGRRVESEVRLGPSEPHPSR